MATRAQEAAHRSSTTMPTMRSRLWSPEAARAVQVTDPYLGAVSRTSTDRLMATSCPIGRLMRLVLTSARLLLWALAAIHSLLPTLPVAEVAGFPTEASRRRAAVTLCSQALPRATGARAELVVLALR